MIFLFWMMSFKPTFSLFSFDFIKRLFISSSLSAIRVVSSVYLRVLIFLPAVLIPACASSSLAFCTMYSAYKLNKQGDNIQPWCTPFPILNQSISSSNCCFLTYIQISQEAGKMFWYFHIFENFPQFVVIHTIKGFSIINKAEVDVFLGFFCFFIQWMLAICSLVSLPFLNPTWTSESSRFKYCWSLACPTRIPLVPSLCRWDQAHAAYCMTGR